MYQIAAPIWNQIAEEQDVATPAAGVAFCLDYQELAIMADAWTKLEEEAGTTPGVARCVPIALPLLLEHRAISRFLSRYPDLRAAMPELLDAEEAASLMQAEFRLTDVETVMLVEVLSSPDAEDRWEKAAIQAALTEREPA